MTQLVYPILGKRQLSLGFLTPDPSVPSQLLSSVQKVPLGYPYFSTDTGMMLRAAELKCDAVLSAKNVDGVYDKDPNQYSDAKKFDSLTYSEMLSLGLRAIDQSAAAIGEECGMKTVIFALSDPKNIVLAAHGEDIGTLLHK